MGEEIRREKKQREDVEVAEAHTEPRRRPRVDAIHLPTVCTLARNFLRALKRMRAALVPSKLFARRRSSSASTQGWARAWAGVKRAEGSTHLREERKREGGKEGGKVNKQIDRYCSFPGTLPFSLPSRPPFPPPNPSPTTYRSRRMRSLASGEMCSLRKRKKEEGGRERKRERAWSQWMQKTRGTFTFHCPSLPASLPPFLPFFLPSLPRIQLELEVGILDLAKELDLVLVVEGGVSREGGRDGRREGGREGGGQR